MSYLGFRIEIVNSLLVRNMVKRLNSKVKASAQIFELVREGKITVERRNDMLIAHGTKSDHKTGVANFSLMSEVSEGDDELSRLVQIMNVLGNDRLIKERVSALISGKSLLNALPQLIPIKNSIVKIEEVIPGFIRSAWYYAPEAIFDTPAQK